MPRTIWSGAISFGLVTSLNYAGDESDALVRPYPSGV
jgi:non-homologous end joining protein Ku